MIFSKGARPAFQSWYMAEKPDKFDDHTILVAADEEIDASTAEAGHEEEDDAHADIDGQDVEKGESNIDDDAGCPEPEVGKDVHHGKDWILGKLGVQEGVLR